MNALQHALKGGCVAPRPFLEGSDRGVVYLDSWLPEGWVYQIAVGNPKQYGSVASPIVPLIVMRTKDERSVISYVATNVYEDISQGGMGMNGMFGPMVGYANVFGSMAAAEGYKSYLDPQSNMRVRQLTDASQLCDECAVSYVSALGLRLCGVIQETSKPDPIARARYRELLQTMSPDLQRSAWPQWHRRLYNALSQDGAEFIVMTEVKVTTNGFNVCRQPMQRLWQTDYEVFLSCPADEFPATFKECNRVRESIRCGADFQSHTEAMRTFMLQQAMITRGGVNNAISQMMSNNAAHADRMSAIIQGASDHATNVMHDMMASNAATNDRVANMQFETIGGYDVYRGTDGNLVQADIAFDHVYQGTVDGQDWLLGMEGSWFEPGADFTHLDQIKGGDY